MNLAQDMGTKPILQLLAKFAIPSIFSLVLHALYNIVDRIFIGRGVGALGLAGVTLCFPVMLFIFGFCLLFSSGSSSLISIYLGEKKINRAEEILGNTFTLLTLCGVIITFLGLFFFDDLIGLLTVNPQIIPHARGYMITIFSGIILFFYGFTFTFLIRAEGNPLYATMMIVVGTIINLICDPVFIFILKMGTTGAALATIISEAVVVLMGVFYIMNKKGIVHIRMQNLKLKFVNVKRIIYLGLSPALMDFTASLQVGLLNSRILALGSDVDIAAVGIAFPVMSLIHLFTFGMAAGMQPLIGYNYGANNFRRVKDVFRYSCEVTFLITAVLVGFLMISAESITRLFCPDNNVLVSLSAYVLRIVMLTTPLMAIHILSARYFQSVGKGMHAIFLGLMRQIFIFVPIIFSLSYLYGLTGVWFSFPVTNTIAIFVTVIVLVFEMKKLSGKFEN